MLVNCKQIDNNFLKLHYNIDQELITIIRLTTLGNVQLAVKITIYIYIYLYIYKQKKAMQLQKASKSGSVQGLFRRQNIKYVHRMVILIIFDKIDRCIGWLTSRHLRRLIKDSEEEPTVPSAPRDKLMNLISLYFDPNSWWRGLYFDAFRSLLDFIFVSNPMVSSSIYNRYYWRSK